MTGNKEAQSRLLMPAQEKFFEKTLWEKEKMLVIGISPFPLGLFYVLWKNLVVCATFDLSSANYFGVSKMFSFAM